MAEKRITLLVNMQQEDLSENNLCLEIDDTGSLVLYPHNDEDNFTYARVEEVETLRNKTDQNKWEELFDDFMELTEFTLIKHKTPSEDGIWSVEDNQGANLGDIEADRFKDASQIFERMNIYIRDYIDEDLENVWTDELGYSIDDAPNTIEGWLDHKEELKEYQFELDLIDMICHHANEINLENCYYEEEE